MAEGDPQHESLADVLRANGYVGAGAGNNSLLAALPVELKNRVRALKRIQLSSIEIEAKFYARVHQLEKEFEAEFNKVYEERRKIVSGEADALPDDAKIDLIHGLTEEELKAIDEGSEKYNNEKGLPDFWLNVLKVSDSISEMIQEADEPILKYLTDITTTVEDKPEGFTIYFHFAENPYFKNSVLTKKYLLQMSPDPEDPFEFDGPAVIKCIGDQIQWNEGKNVTTKVIKKKQKKGGNAGKFLTKTVKADSFFNFFDPPEAVDPDHKNEDDDDDDETNELLRSDFEIGQVLRDHVIPRAVLFYTGEASEDDIFDYDEDEDEDEGDEDGDEDDE